MINLVTDAAGSPVQVRLGAAAELASAFACAGLAAAAGWFLIRRKDLAPAARLLGGLLVAFLLARVLTHVMAIVTLWTEIPGGILTVKLLTATVSVTAAALAWPQLPKLLALPSPNDLARSNAALAQANSSLETAIAWRTYELEQANERFELALARSSISVFTQDRDLRFTWVCNPRPGIAPALDRRGDAAPMDEAPEVVDLKRGVLATGAATAGAVAIPGPEGIRHYDLMVSPTRNREGVVDGILCTAVDTTETRRFNERLAALAAQVAAAYDRIELALENSPITVFEQDRDLRYTFVHNPPSGQPETYLGRTDEEIFGEADLRGLAPVKRRVLESSRPERVELELTFDGEPRYLDIRLEPRTGATGMVEGLVGTAVDLSERRRDERQMRLVMRELTHRSKNLLAVIQAMARKTASTAPDLDTFIRDFSARLRAIAAAHDLLVAESWSGAELRDLLTASLAQTIDPAAPEIRIDGPVVRLSPDTAQTLGLAFHELTMNAVRHGALSVPGGRLSVLWRRDDGLVALEWRESGGPTVAAPGRNGFGRVLLERLVGSSLGGTVTMDFRPEGLVCSLRFPDDRLAAA
jgi:two-component sensor histidine kinase